MKKFLMGAILAAMAMPAMAADLPLRKAPPYAAPAFNWTGCYVGVHVGAGGMHDYWTGEHGNGGLAGGQIGCNYQAGMLVVGIEGEGFWSGIKTNFETNFVIPPFGAVTYETKNKYDYDVALRLGIALDRTLIYGKIGWVWGQFDFRFYDNNPGGVPYTHTGSSGLSGLLLGLGAEHALGGNWSVKFEYNYLNFAARSVAFTHCFLPGACFHELNESQSAEKHIVKLGINYQFGLGKAPVVAKY
jgi:outer membrane immunogenic protein